MRVIVDRIATPDRHNQLVQVHKRRSVEVSKAGKKSVPMPHAAGARAVDDHAIHRNGNKLLVHVVKVGFKHFDSQHSYWGGLI